MKGIGSAVDLGRGEVEEELFQALREDKPLAPAKPKPAAGAPKQAQGTLVDVAEMRVQVYNGTPKDGLGKDVDAGLRATGFNTTDAPLNGKLRDLARTLVTYDPRWDRSAKSLAAALPGSELRAVKGQGATMEVTAGSDFTKVRPVRAESDQTGEFATVTGDEVVCPR
ncbi:LCP family protein required for cell wall assembly OS=Streptomyces albaduncus OX=68172 GN=FHS32_006234 PE=3 SV=1 [Streptomyces griseoloalbus]